MREESWKTMGEMHGATRIFRRNQDHIKDVLPTIPTKVLGKYRDNTADGSDKFLRNDNNHL
jgi:hypothetical protein